MTVRALMIWAAGCLEACGIGEAAAEAAALWRGLFELSLNDYARRLFDEADPDAEAHFREAVKRRCGGEPVQRIIGRAPFMDDDFEINAATLIPRFDSEVLVLEAEKALMGREEARVLDMCTGSGCLILSLLKRHPHLTGVGSDIAGEAVEAARRNAARIGIDRVAFVTGDLFSPVTGTYDIILSNPPYIRHDDIARLDEEVRSFEPAAALDGGADGLDFYRRIIDEAPVFLNDGGVLLFEIGCDEGAETASLMRQAGFRDVRIVRDLAGLDRVVSGVK